MMMKNLRALNDCTVYCVAPIEKDFYGLILPFGTRQLEHWHTLQNFLALCFCSIVGLLDFSARQGKKEDKLLVAIAGKSNNNM